MGRFSAMNYELKRRTSLNPNDSTATGGIVAEIGPTMITRADLDNMIEAEVEMQLSQLAGSLSPEQFREQKKRLLDDIFKKGQRSEWLQRLIAEELLYRRAREEKMQDREDVKALLDSIDRKILAEKYLDSEYQKRIHIVPDDLKGYYEAHKDDFRKDGKVRPFDEVKDEVYRIVRSNREKEVQQAVMNELMDRYDVVIHQDALGTGAGTSSNIEGSAPMGPRSNIKKNSGGGTGLSAHTSSSAATNAGKNK
ncbi:MAG: hypothetical protein B6D63_04795 [Candidatus Latescibacteria bacterium 4484_7]|nr:MAG: hypothetical protein B6D63_04795 [Candidatus Latescibacteria bacterium 4484_7]